jgi:FdhD protein
MTTRLSKESSARRPDRVVAEEPMEIRLDDDVVTVTMRTPGHDYELATGFCFTEGLLADMPVKEVRYCAVENHEYNSVTVSTDGRAPRPTARLQPTTSSCGICGSASLDALSQRMRPRADPPPPIDLDTLLAVADEVRRRQSLFEETGSIHAAAAFDPVSGAVDIVREDIGRHNAVDKVVGSYVLAGKVPPAGVFVSGRVSFEIVQKAWAGGFALIAAVSGPSALAVETARHANIALVGFLRATSANIYAPEPS